MADKFKPKQLSQFILNEEYKNDGFNMLTKVEADMVPKSPQNRLTIVRELGKFCQTKGEKTDAFLQRARTLHDQLAGVSVSELIPLFVIAGMDPDVYSGVFS